MTTIQDALAVAISHHEAGRLNEAAEIYRRILAAEPTYGPAWYLLGTIAYHVGDTQTAIDNFRHTLELNPDLAVVHNDLGLAYRDTGNFAAAALCFRRAVALQVDLVAAHFNLGNVLNQLGQHDEAIMSYERCLQLKPEHAEAANNLGTAHQAKCEIQTAVDCYQRALTIDPNFADAYSNLGSAYQEQGELEAALICCQRAIDLRPDNANAYRNLGAVHQQVGKLQEAEACYRRALEIAPIDPAILDNLGSILQGIGRFDEAVACHRRAIALSPHLASAHYNESLILLLYGDFARGWNKYEFRWKTKQRRGRDFPERRWERQSLVGRTILLRAEQGLGDTIQFIRYCSLVKALGATVVVECPKSIARLLDSCAGIDQVVGQGEPLPTFDVHCPLLSLPRIFATTLDSIPKSVPYLFAESARIIEWRTKLDATSETRVKTKQGATNRPTFRIGVNWRGQTRQGVWSSRNIPLEHFTKLTERSDWWLISLQKDGRDELVTAQNFWPEQTAGAEAPTDLGGSVDSACGAFLDTAAIMMNVDMVISCDTSVAHLAGALGVPIWVGLPFAHDWRWLVERSDSPWYPTMRLFRQKSVGDWNGVFGETAEALLK